MSKRWLALLLAVLLTLSACGRRPEEPQEPRPQETQPQETEETIPAEKPEEPQLDVREVTETDRRGFYDLTRLPALQGVTVQDAGLRDQGQLVLLTGPGGSQVQILDWETGQLNCIAQLEAEETAAGGGTFSVSYSLVNTDPLVVAADGRTSRFFRLYEDGTVQQLPYGEENGWRSYYATAMDDQYYYYWEDLSRTVYRCHYDGTGETPVAQIPPEYLYPMLMGFGEERDQLVFQATTLGEEDAVSLVLELSDGSLSEVYEGIEDAWTLLEGTQVRLVYPTEADPTEAYTITLWAEGASVSETLDLAWLVGAEETDSLEGCWMEPPESGTPWGLALIGAWSGETCRLLLWDYSQEEPKADPRPLTEYVWPVYDLGEITQRAQAMAEQYGVQIYLGEQAALAPFPDYTLEPSQDLKALQDGLDVLDQALSSYPEGYLEQLGGTPRALCFYLSGRMTPLYPSMGIDDPSGLACQVDGLELIAFNVDYLRVEEVNHELAHVLDHRLWEAGTLDEQVWNSLNPQGFQYYQAYIDENGEDYEYTGSTEYTTWDESYYGGNTEEVYFIDTYSKTFPTEDRAQLMGAFLSQLEGEMPAYFASPHLQAKLEYYFQCIRDTFDTTGWPERTSWEQALGELTQEES